ncbi:hypothetical protein NST84_21900 [Paenibacillus sp. FSL R7-0345]
MRGAYGQEVQAARSGGEPLFIFTGEPGSYIALEDRGLELL